MRGWFKSVATTVLVGVLVGVLVAHAHHLSPFLSGSRESYPRKSVFRNTLMAHRKNKAADPIPITVAARINQKTESIDLCSVGRLVHRHNPQTPIHPNAPKKTPMSPKMHPPGVLCVGYWPIIYV